MVSKILLIGDVFDVDIIPQNLLHDENMKIFSFDLDTHNKLESEKIPHEMADNLLSRDDRLKLFDVCFDFLSWHSKLPSSDFTFENVNLLKLVDSTEFHMFFIPQFLNFVIIKRIFENEVPSKIFSSSIFSSIIHSIDDNIETHYFKNSSEQKLLWDTIPIKYNFGKRNFSLKLSRKKYLKIKSFIEFNLYFLCNFGFNFKNKKKKNLLFLEFNSQAFSRLFRELKNYDGNIILINQRRPAIWDKTSFNVIRNSKCKVLQLEKILNKNEQKEISILYEKFSKNINKLWENTEFFTNLFRFENVSFWNVIKEQLIHIHSDKLFYYMKSIVSIKKIYDNVDVSCIISLNEIGETEKSFLEVNNNRYPSILLEHGFWDNMESNSIMKRYDDLSSYVTFRDKIAVWSEMKKKYLIDNYKFDPERIIVTGSPRHDTYFSSRMKIKNTKEKVILLAPKPIGELSGLSTTELKLQFNELIKKIILVIKKWDNVKIIVKLHPFPLKHNEEIKSLIKEIDENIPIYLSQSVINVINLSDIVLVVSPELGTTSMLLESMILGKPTMNIYFENKIPKYNHVKHNAVFSVLSNCDMEQNLQKILFDKTFQNDLINNADNFITKYLKHNGDSSEEFSKILKSY